MPTATPDPLSPLLSQIRADQSERWRRGERVRVEHYLALYPHLAGQTEVLLELIGYERQHRVESGEHPSLEEYLARFPQLGEAVRRMWASSCTDEQGGRSESDILISTAPQLTAETSPPWRRTPVPTLPGFEMQAKLGESGMGIVYKARDVRLNQLRAIKFIRAAIAGEDAQERFGREAKAVARLDHPGVVRIYAMGEHEGELFICMEYLEGGNLQALLRRGPLDVRQAAEVVRQLAQAVQHAHDNKVLHRDLKPANVLLTAGGVPKVADFGLAKLLDEDDGLTRIGDVMGTPSYMAPEQAEGRVRDVGTPADVWALGAILYECLIGRPAFKGEGRTETMELVKKQAPVPPRRLRAEVPAALEAICLKCLEKRTQDRYASAAELADDLQAWLDGKPVRPRTGQRHKLLTATLLLLVLAALIGGLLVVLPRRQPEADPASARGQNGLGPAAPSSRSPAEITLIPGVWNPLLTREPIPLRWPRGGKNNYKHFLPGAQEITVSCEELGLLALGETSAPRYQFAITLHQTPWVGNIGVFFGYQASLVQGQSGQRYQVLELTSDISAKQGRLLRVGWSSVFHAGVGTGQSRLSDTQNVSAPFPSTPSEHRLMLTVGPKGLEKVTWDDKVLDGLHADKAALPPPLQDYQGLFGIYACNGGGSFRDARYQFDEEP